MLEECSAFIQRFSLRGWLHTLARVAKAARLKQEFEELDKKLTTVHLDLNTVLTMAISLPSTITAESAAVNDLRELASFVEEYFSVRGVELTPEQQAQLKSAKTVTSTSKDVALDSITKNYQNLIEESQQLAEAAEDIQFDDSLPPSH